MIFPTTYSLIVCDVISTCTQIQTFVDTTSVDRSKSVTIVCTVESFHCTHFPNWGGFNDW